MGVIPTPEELKEAIRNSTHRTQERVAVATGINEAILSKYCRGLKTPSPRHLEKLRQVLDEER